MVSFVVFTLQTAGRYNRYESDFIPGELFLPCKQQADATFIYFHVLLRSCFYLANSRQMQQSTKFGMVKKSCFYLANSRQMQQEYTPYNHYGVVFTLQTAGRCNNCTLREKDGKVVFTLQTAGRCNTSTEKPLITFVVFTLQTAGRCNGFVVRIDGKLVVFTLQTAGRCNRTTK